MQTDDVGPDGTGERADFLGDSIQFNGFVRLREEPVGAELLHARTLRHVLHQLVDLTGPVRVPLEKRVDELRRFLLRRIVFIGSVLRIVFRVWLSLEQILDQSLLTDRCRSGLFHDGNMLRAFPRPHVPHQIRGVLLRCVARDVTHND